MSFWAAIRDSIEVSDKKIRDFGIVMLVVLSGIIPLFLAWRAGWELGTVSWTLIAIGLVLFLASVLMPMRIRRVYVGWMGLAIILGLVMTKVIISLVFYLIMTPIGLGRRLLVRDPLGVRRDNESESYWTEREKAPKPASSYEKQY